MKNKRIKQITYQDIKDIDLQEYSLGGWMKENAGVIGTVAGVGLGALGSIVAPGAGTVAGMALGTSIGSALGGSIGGAVQNDYQTTQAMNQQNAATKEQTQLNRLNMLNQQIQQQPQFKCGGRLKKMRNGGDLATMEYGGLPHEGGGVKVDSTGTPVGNNVNNAVAEVEKGEVGYNGYIFSDKLMFDSKNSFAKEAKRRTNKFPKKGLDSIDAKTKEKVMNDLVAAQDKTREYLGLEEQATMMRNGGGLPKYVTGGGVFDRFRKPTNLELSQNVPQGQIDVYNPETGRVEYQNRMQNNNGFSDPFYNQNDYWSNEFKNDTYASQFSNNMTTLPNVVDRNKTNLNSINIQPWNITQNKSVIPQQQITNSIPMSKEYQTQLDNLNRTDRIETAAKGGMYDKMQADSQPQGTPYGGMTSGQFGAQVLAGAIPVIGNILGANRIKKRGFTKVNSGQIANQNYSEQALRDAAARQAAVAGSNMRRGLKESGSTGQYMSNVGAGETALAANTSNIMGQSYEREANKNAENRSRTDMFNAQLRASDAQQNAQLEAQRNNQLDAYRAAIWKGASDAIINPLNSMAMSQQQADYAQMINPDYVLMSEYEEAPEGRFQGARNAWRRNFRSTNVARPRV